MRISSSFRCRSASSFFPPILNREAPAAGRPLFAFCFLLLSSRSEDSSTAAV